jgi:hypothetical protein
LIQGKASKLQEIMRPHQRFLSLIAEKTTRFDDRAEQAVIGESGHYRRTSLLLSWLEENDDSPEALDAFLAALRETNQGHVANFITSEPGDLPLPADMVARLRKIKAKLADNILIEHSP